MSQSITASRVAGLVGDFSRSPAYAGLADSLRLLIGDGRIGVDVRLPSERDLTTALDVSRTTVTRAYEVLRESGYAAARRGAGTFTRVPGGRARAQDRSLLPHAGIAGAIDLSCAAPSSPPGLAAAFAQASDQLPAYLSGTGYFPLGVPELQSAIADHFAARGLPTVPEQIMVTPGALSAAAIVSQALARPGERALVESPTYPNSAQAIRHSGARLVAVPIDPGVRDLAALGHAVRESRSRLAYLIPDFHNPTGHLMSDEDRARIAEELRRSETVPVIDEAHQALALDADLVDAMPRPFAVHSPEAITIGSASKSHWGGLRLGWVRAPLAMVDSLLHTRIGLDLGAPVFEQLVLARLLAQPDVLEANRTRLRLQRDALVAACGDLLPEWRFLVPSGGLALWCELPHGSATALATAAEQAGVNVSAGPVFAVEGGLDRFVRIPWTRSEADLTEAVRRLALAWDQVGTTRPGRDVSRPGRVLVA